MDKVDKGLGIETSTHCLAISIPGTDHLGWRNKIRPLHPPNNVLVNNAFLHSKCSQND